MPQCNVLSLAHANVVNPNTALQLPHRNISQALVQPGGGQNSRLACGGIHLPAKYIIFQFSD